MDEYGKQFALVRERKYLHRERHPLFVVNFGSFDALVVLVEFVGPIAHPSDVEGEVILVFWC